MYKLLYNPPSSKLNINIAYAINEEKKFNLRQRIYFLVFLMYFMFSNL